jgi:hypothetical protein
VIGSDPPPTEGYVDAGFGSIYETVGFTGALIAMFGTAVWWLCRKQVTLAYSTAESELYAATEISKFIKWLRVLRYHSRYFGFFVFFRFFRPKGM